MHGVCVCVSVCACMCVFFRELNDTEGETSKHLFHQLEKQSEDIHTTHLHTLFLSHWLSLPLSIHSHIYTSSYSMQMILKKNKEFRLSLSQVIPSDGIMPERFVS